MTQSPSAADRPALTGNIRGMLWLILSGLFFTVFLVLAKQLSSSQDPLVLAFWRSFVGLLVTLPIIVHRGFGILKITRPRIVFLRSLCGTAAFIASMYAISDVYELPLSQFNALSFSRALFITLLAALFLREQVGHWRWGAVLVGFCGILVMLLPSGDQPDAFVINPGVALALLSALGFAGAIIMVKSLSATHSTMTLLIWANLLSSILLAPFLFARFDMPMGTEWGWLTAMSLAGVIGQYCYIRAMTVGDASFLAPVDYLRLPMAALADWVIFKALPENNVWYGTAIIVAAALLITLRERKAKQPDLT
jgi:drug/metabolite transporter (DMT)-like permease